MRILKELTLNTIATISPSSSTTNNNDMVNSNNLWKSPIPYLFGSLALMLLLIAIALILLTCSFAKRSRRGGGGDEEKPSNSIKAVDLEPGVVVIMAGEERPSYLATPALTIAMPSTNICSCGRGGDQQIKAQGI